MSAHIYVFTLSCIFWFSGFCCCFLLKDKSKVRGDF